MLLEKGFPGFLIRATLFLTVIPEPTAESIAVVGYLVLLTRLNAVIPPPFRRSLIVGHEPTSTPD
jgi:hypothetical protein